MDDPGVLPGRQVWLRSDPAGKEVPGAPASNVGKPDLDRGSGRVRVGVGVLYAKTGLAAEGRGVAVVQNDIGSLWEIAPELSLRIARFGTGIEARVDAGPTIDFWNFDGEQRWMVETKMVRARNRVADALQDSTDLIDEMFARLK